MRIIAFIEGEEVIKKILKHLGLWEVNPPHFRRVKPRPPPRMAKAQPLCTEPHIDYSDTQVFSSDNRFYVDPIPACA
jgi:hypothetical protein